MGMLSHPQRVIQLSFLKPTKRNVIGTALLLVANWLGSYLSRLLSQLINPRNSGGSGSDFVATGGRGNFAAGGNMQFGNASNIIISQAINIIILAMLFYMVISFIAEKMLTEDKRVIGVSTETSETQEKKKKY